MIFYFSLETAIWIAYVCHSSSKSLLCALPKEQPHTTHWSTPSETYQSSRTRLSGSGLTWQQETTLGASRATTTMAMKRQGQLYYSGPGSLEKGQIFLISWVHSSGVNNFKMDWDKLSLLSFTEKLGYLWLFGVGFMEKSLSVLEWQLFEKKFAKKKFLVLVK